MIDFAKYGGKPLGSAGKADLRKQTEAEGWKLVWSDEFDYTGLPDPKKWVYEEGHIRNNESQYYTRERRENARVENGMLILEARKEPFKGSGYTSASINTLGKYAVEYGRIEIRAKLPAGRGTWPAFWSMGEDIGTVGWPRCAELDIMEFVGHDPGVIHGTLHQGTGDALNYWSKGDTTTVPDCTDAFHVYGVEWSKEKIDFFADNKVYFTFPYQGPTKWTMDRRCYLMLNLAIGGPWGGQKGIDDALFPHQYLIEYVRVFQKKR